MHMQPHTDIDLDHDNDRDLGYDLHPYFYLDLGDDIDPEFDLDPDFDLDIDLGNDLELDLGKFVLQIMDL